MNLERAFGFTLGQSDGQALNKFESALNWESIPPEPGDDHWVTTTQKFQSEKQPLNRAVSAVAQARSSGSACERRFNLGSTCHTRYTKDLISSPLIILPWGRLSLGSGRKNLLRVTCCDITNARLSFLDKTDPQGRNLAIY